MPALQVPLFFFTLVTGPRRSLNLKRSDTTVYEPQIRARLGTTAHCWSLSPLPIPPSQHGYGPWTGPPREMTLGTTPRERRLVPTLNTPWQNSLPPLPPTTPYRQREFFIDNLLVRIHFIIVMIRWTGLAPWEFEFPVPGSLTSTFLAGGVAAGRPSSGTRER